MVKRKKISAMARIYKFMYGLFFSCVLYGCIPYSIGGPNLHIVNLTSNDVLVLIEYSYEGEENTSLIGFNLIHAFETFVDERYILVNERYILENESNPNRGIIFTFVETNNPSSISVDTKLSEMDKTKLGQCISKYYSIEDLDANNWIVVYDGTEQ